MRRSAFGDMRKLLLYCGLCGLSIVAKAQQRPQYAQYMLNNFLLNPAIAGVEDYADVKLSSRSQWVGIEGAPVTFYLTGHTRLGQQDRPSMVNGSVQKLGDFAPSSKQYGNYRRRKPFHGLGASVLHDRIGPFVRTEAQVTYAYHVWLTKDIKLASGLSAGVAQQSFRAGKASFADPTDVLASGRSSAAPTASAGVWLYASNFYAGTSAYSVFQSKTEPATANPTPAPHLFLTAAYKFMLLPEVAVVPSVLVKLLQPLPVSLDFSLRTVFADRLWVGVAYRQDDSFSGLAGISLNHTFDIGYAYDLGRSNVSTASQGSHELVLGVRLLNRQKAVGPSNLW